MDGLRGGPAEALKIKGGNLLKNSKSGGAIYYSWPCFHIILRENLQILRKTGGAIAPPAPWAPPALAAPNADQASIRSQKAEIKQERGDNIV